MVLTHRNIQFLHSSFVDSYQSCNNDSETPNEYKNISECTLRVVNGNLPTKTIFATIYRKFLRSTANG